MLYNIDEHRSIHNEVTYSLLPSAQVEYFHEQSTEGLMDNTIGLDFQVLGIYT